VCDGWRMVFASNDMIPLAGSFYVFGVEDEG
jgi:hypothetical protein